MKNKMIVIRIFCGLILIGLTAGMALLIPTNSQVTAQYPGPITPTPNPTPSPVTYPIIHEPNNLYPFWDGFTCWPDGFRQMIGTWRNMPANYLPDLSDPIGYFTVKEGTYYYTYDLMLDVNAGGWDLVNRTLHFWGWYWINNPARNIDYTVNGSIYYNTTHQDILSRDFHPYCYTGTWLPMIWR